MPLCQSAQNAHGKTKHGPEAVPRRCGGGGFGSPRRARYLGSNATHGGSSTAIGSSVTALRRGCGPPASSPDFQEQRPDWPSAGYEPPCAKCRDISAGHLAGPLSVPVGHTADPRGSPRLLSRALPRGPTIPSAVVPLTWPLAAPYAQATRQQPQQLNSRDRDATEAALPRERLR